MLARDKWRSLSRRNLVTRYPAALTAALHSMNFASGQPSEVAGGRLTLLDYRRGHYSFLRGIAAYSAGAVAKKGYEIVHATFSRPRPLRAGFSAVAEHLAALNIPKVALCALELRSPRPLSSEEFRAFNSSYIEVLANWGILEGGVNPVARTNVAPGIFPPSEPGIHAFSYLAPFTDVRPTFIVAGAGELPDGSTNPSDILRRGETSPSAIAEKAIRQKTLLHRSLHRRLRCRRR